MWNFLVAYAVFWAITFIFVFSIFNRQRNLQRELETIKRALEIGDEKSSRS